MIRRHFLTLALAAGLAAGFAASAAAAPQNVRADGGTVAIVTMFYKISAGKDGKYSGNSIFFQDKIRAQYFSKRLRAELAALDKKSKQKDEPGIDFDPVTDSQDPSVKDLKIEQDGESDGESAVKASFSYADGGVRKFVRYVFVRQNDAWKLDNMRSGPAADGWEMRKLIKDIMAGFSK